MSEIRLRLGAPCRSFLDAVVLMSGVLLTVAEFRDQATTRPDQLIRTLQDHTGRYGAEEEQAWRASLPALAHAFEQPQFDDLHLYFKGRGRMALEYRLPSASHWCDVVLLGKKDNKPSAVIIELKHWQTRADRPGTAEGLMIRQGRQELHPSDQVRGYTEYCRRFHSAVAEFDADVSGCVLFTRDYFCQAYRQPPNDTLAESYPLFTLSPSDLDDPWPRFFQHRLTEPSEEFATSFAQGVYRQDRSFVEAVGQQLKDPHSSPLELLDGQRRALALTRANVESSLFSDSGPEKTVVVVDGPPGSGKSVVAARLWASLVTDRRLPEGNVTFVTTSVAQSTNWQQLFGEAAGNVAARGVVLKANAYIPYTTHDIGRINHEHPGVLGDVQDWRDNYRLLRQLYPGRNRSPDEHFLASVVDEAHALINPEHRDARGQFGFAVHAGPQAFHIIRSSVVSIFFLDPKQSFRERESTTVDEISQWADELGARFVGPISLADAQFRCAGSKEYVDWVDTVVSLRTTERYRPEGETLAQPIPDAAEPSHPRSEAGLPSFQFRIFDDPFMLEDALRARIAEGHSVRLLASFARPWRTRPDRIGGLPHDLPDELKDFHEPIRTSQGTRYWSRVWNYIPNDQGYTQYVRAPVGSPLHDDPLCEVGCPYAVRGFDFDYAGILWLGDVKRRGDRWVVDVDSVHESGLTHHIQRARRENDPEGPAHQDLLRKLLQGYRILLTRAMKGTYVWFEDEETRDFVQQSASPFMVTEHT